MWCSAYLYTYFFLCAFTHSNVVCCYGRVCADGANDINRSVHLAFLIPTKWNVFSSYVAYIWHVSCHSSLHAQIPRWVECCFHDTLKLTMQLEHSQLACDVLLTEYWILTSGVNGTRHKRPSEVRCSVLSTGKLELNKPFGWEVKRLQGTFTSPVAAKRPRRPGRPSRKCCSLFNTFGHIGLLFALCVLWLTSCNPQQAPLT